MEEEERRTKTGTGTKETTLSETKQYKSPRMVLHDNPKNSRKKKIRGHRKRGLKNRGKLIRRIKEQKEYDSSNSETLQKTLGMSTETSTKVEISHHYRNTIDSDKPKPTNPIWPHGTRRSIQETIQSLPKLASEKGWGATDSA